jgi:phage gpG-like protein
MDPEKFAQHLLEMQKQIEQFANSNAPEIAGKIAVDHFTENFQEGTEGFINNGLQKWQEVKRRLNPKNQDLAEAKNPILTGKTGDLGRSIEAKEAQNGQVIICSNLPYSAAHNYGTETAGRKKNTKIPKRQFIGNSKELNEKIKTELEKKLNETILDLMDGE